MQPRRAAHRGFTLIELMIVVVIMGVFAAVSVPALLDAIRRAKTTEATLELDHLKRMAKQIFNESHHYVIGVAATLPIRPGAGGCCHGPDERCAPEPEKFAADPVWKALDFTLREPSIFYYDYTGTAGAFTAQATGDFDCDGTEVAFTLTGTTLNTTTPIVTLTAPSVAVE